MWEREASNEDMKDSDSGNNSYKVDFSSKAVEMEEVEEEYRVDFCNPNL